MLNRIFSGVYDFFSNLMTVVGEGISNMFAWLGQMIIDFLKILFAPILYIVGFIFYLIFKIGEIAVLLLNVLYQISMIFVSLIKGIFLTLAGLTYTPNTADHGTWTSIFNNISDSYGLFQLDNVAYVLMFLIWISTAFIAVRTLASMRGGS